MKKFAFILTFLFASAFVFSQTQLAYSGDSGYTLVERTDLRRYVNGKYSGLTSREVRSFISRSEAPKNVRSAKGDRWYNGNFFVMEETLRNSQATMAGIHDAISSAFKISPEGHMTMIEDNGYPTFRSFPSYTTEKLNPGDSWSATAERAVDPLNKGVFTRMPISVRYTFSGSEIYKGENVYRIKASWKTNYSSSSMDRDPRGDGSLARATGGHNADIIVRESTGEAILISDTVDETFAYVDGTQVNFKGRITLFTEYPPVIDRQKLIQALNRIASAPPAPEPTPAPAEVAEAAPEVTATFGSKASFEPKNSMVFEETPAGIRLSVRDIKFTADSDTILETEKTRLDEIAEVLKLAPNSQFLIEGHTAAVGNPAGEQKLSEQRARRIANELAARGINASRFICKGHGGNKPIASNETSEGKAQNRRVEITILQ